MGGFFQKENIMDLKSYYCPDPNEKPLDNLVEDGGFAKIFRRIAYVGDSLSSGEFEAVDATGKRTYHDMFEYSWGQYISRSCGNTGYNFSRGGMTAKEYCESFAQAKGFWDADKACQAYVIALGVNDVINQHMPIGTINICFDLAVAVLTGIAFGDMTRALYSGVAIFVTGQVIDAVVYRFDYSKAVMIMSEKPAEVSKALMEEFETGTTLWTGRGGYSNNEKTVIYFVVNRFQIARMRNLVHALDPKAFMTITDVADVFKANDDQ